MNKRITKTVTISLPPQLVEVLDRACHAESRTRSELFREALRTYVSRAPARTIQVVTTTPDEAQALHAAQKDFEENHTVRLADLQHALGLNSR